MENEDSLGNDYLVRELIGSGGQASVYLVKDKNSGIEYVAKLREKDKPDNEFKLNKAISAINPPSPYILRYFKHGTAGFKRKGKYFENVPYLIIEKAAKGDLYKYIDITGGFEEKYAKLFFKKILLGVQSFHNIGVYHLDLKVDNILLDDKYNPKICDFGLGSDDSGILVGYRGTKEYMPPQILEHKQYTGIKADIFCLGSLLFIIVTGLPCFHCAEKKDYFYKFIVKKDYKGYIDTLGEAVPIVKTLKKDFTDLLTRMIAYEESDRPKNIQEILNDKWFKEVEEKKNELEFELEKLFKEKEKKVCLFIQDTDYLKKDMHSFGANRGLNDDFDNEIFSRGIIPKSKNINLGMDCYIKIKGDLNYYQFMNSLLDKIKKKFEDENCDIEKSDKNYECDIIFKKNENEEESEEENEEENEEEKEEEKEDNNNDNVELKLFNMKNDRDNCTINLELYKSGKEEYILRFIRLSGSLGEYYSKVNEFICLAKKLL